MLSCSTTHQYKQVQGGILNFEVLRPDGSVFSYKTFEREAADAGFHVRTGAECNPGACYNYLGVTVRADDADCAIAAAVC
jgi:molybdenum cofactor sulfurtransferase